jgi:hypothetical protein
MILKFCGGLTHWIQVAGTLQLGAKVAQSVQCCDYGLGDQGLIPGRGKGYFSSSIYV